MPDPSNPKNPDTPQQALGAYYAREAHALKRTVASAVAASPPIIDDACAFAWCQLAGRLDRIELGKGAFWWLYRVATREAWRQAAAHRRLRPVGGAVDVDALMRDVTDNTYDMVERINTVESLDRLSPRRRRILMLRAAGFSYAEISRITGDTERTVERQITLGRNALRKACEPTVARGK